MDREAGQVTAVVNQRREYCASSFEPISEKADVHNSAIARSHTVLVSQVLPMQSFVSEARGVMSLFELLVTA